MSGAAAAFERRRPRGHWVLLAASVVVALAGGIPLLLSQLSGSRAPGVRVTPLVSAAGLVQRSGVRVVRVALSGDGGLLDVRYQVVDSDKAESIHDAATPPLLIDERTGAVVNGLLMGHIHSNRPKVGLTYYLIFENPGSIVRHGGRVTVQLGDARLAHVPVR